MIENIIFLVLGVIAGHFFPKLVDSLANFFIKAKVSKRNESLKNETIVTWLHNYHEYHSLNHGILNELPFCEIGPYRERVPYLSKSKWDPPVEVSALHKIKCHQDHILRHSQGIHSGFKIDERAIKRRKKFGQKIWNADTLYLEHISYENDMPIFHVKTCEYYASASSMINLEDETIKAVSKNSFKKCNLRQRYYLTTKGIEDNLFVPITIGCLVVFALRTVDGYEIILQTRSDENLTSNAVTSVVPTFGLSPFVGLPPSDKGLLYYNFLREYLEELHCVKETTELIREHSTSRAAEAYYEWLYNSEQAKKLLKCEDFNLYYIGFGFNLTNGNPNIGLLAKLDDISVSQEIKKAFYRNWEVDSLQYVNLDSEDLSNLFSTKRLDPASSFFISKAIKYIS